MVINLKVCKHCNLPVDESGEKLMHMKGYRLQMHEAEL